MSKIFKVNFFVGIKKMAHHKHKPECECYDLTPLIWFGAGVITGIWLKAKCDGGIVPTPP